MEGSFSTSHIVHIAQPDFQRFRHMAVRVQNVGATIDDLFLPLQDVLVCSSQPPVQVREVVEAATRYHRLTRLGHTPQFGALLYDSTHNQQFLDLYFPLLAILSETERDTFYDLTAALALHPHLGLTLLDEEATDRTAELPPSARAIIVGQLLEALWGRIDILELVLARPRSIRLFTSDLALKEHVGRIEGGYDATHQVVNLSLPQLYGSFFSAVPGLSAYHVALCNLLAACDLRTGRLGKESGRLPGLGARDGAFKQIRARQLFLKGKVVEKERYLRFQRGSAHLGDAMPVGTPDLFRSDQAFMAGYFSLFMRVPHYFAKQNPSLYRALAILLRQDPRRFLRHDSASYVDQCRAMYTGSVDLPPTGIHVPFAWLPIL